MITGPIRQDADAVKEKKVIICDFDSLLYFSSYTGMDEYGEKKPEYDETEYEIAEGILREKILGIFLDVEERYEIVKSYIVVKGKGNFRNEIYKDYKAKRKPSLPIIKHLANYLVENFNAVRVDGYEADDVCYSIQRDSGYQGIILTVDKDFNQIPNTIIYNYQKNVWSKTTEQSAKYSLAIQMLMGDATDNIPGIPGIGIKKAEKLIHEEMTTYQYIKEIYKAYVKYYGEEAKEKIRLMYKLLAFHYINKEIIC